MLDYFRRKSSDLLELNIAGGEDNGRQAHPPLNSRRHELDGDSSPEAKDTDQAVGNMDDAEDISMTEPLDMGLFLELAQELEAEEAASSPIRHSPTRPSLTPLVHLGMERLSPRFDWLARQKDAVQITWESQDQAPFSPHWMQSPQHPGSDELPGETQLRGSDEALVAVNPDSHSSNGENSDDDGELPSVTQLQGESLDHGRRNSRVFPFATAATGADILPPQSPHNGIPDALAIYASTGDASDLGSEGAEEIPSETQLLGNANAFVEVARREQMWAQVEEEEEDLSAMETQLPTETQLQGRDDALEGSAPADRLYAVYEAEGCPAEQPERHEVTFTARSGALVSPVQSPVVDRRRELPTDVAESLPGMDQLAGDIDALNIASQVSELEGAKQPPPYGESDELPDTGQFAGSDNVLSPGSQSSEFETSKQQYFEAERGDSPDPRGPGHLSQVDHTDARDADNSSGGADAEGVRLSANGMAIRPTNSVLEDGVPAVMGSSAERHDNGEYEDDDELPSADQLKGVWSDDDELAVMEHLQSDAVDLDRQAHSSTLTVGAIRSLGSEADYDHDPVRYTADPRASAEGTLAATVIHQQEIVVVEGQRLRSTSDSQAVVAHHDQTPPVDQSASFGSSSSVAEGRTRSLASVSASATERDFRPPYAEARCDEEILGEASILPEGDKAASSASRFQPFAPGRQITGTHVSPKARDRSSLAAPTANSSFDQRLRSRRAPDPRTDYATPDPQDGPVESNRDRGSRLAGNFRGPRRAHRLRTDPSTSSERFSPPMLLAKVPPYRETSFKTPNRHLVREEGSSPTQSVARRSDSSVRKTNRHSGVTAARQQNAASDRSGSVTSVNTNRRARSVTGRLGYIPPQDDPYLHDKNGGPLEPDPDYVAPEVYPIPQQRAMVRGYRPFRRWTESEALLLYRTVQKAWFSERTAQQVVWYLHGANGRLSQKLRAFTVQNMKDKMREIVKTRVRNDRAVVGRARHWLPANHPDRVAYEEEMAEWADAQKDQLERELRELEAEDEAIRLAQRSDSEVSQDEVSVASRASQHDESSDDDMDWEANPDILIGPVVDSEGDSGGVARKSSRRDRRNSSLTRSTREASLEVAYQPLVDEEMSDMGDLDSEEDLAEDISVVSQSTVNCS